MQWYRNFRLFYCLSMLYCTINYYKKEGIWTRVSWFVRSVGIYCFPCCHLPIFRWGTHLYMSLFPSVRPSVRPSVHRAPYLRNCTSFNHNFWYTCVKWWYLRAFFSFFIFEIFIFWAVMGVKGQKIAQNEKYNYIRHTPYLRNSKAYDHDFCYTYVKWWYILVFFLIFLNFSFFGLSRG